MKYFTINELCYSTTANYYGITNKPNLEIVKHLNELVDNILDPLRKAWGTPIKVTSGYRAPKTNSLVGGSKTSAHLQGYAADLIPSNGQITQFKNFTMKWLKDNNIQFDQYINEHSGNSEWVHIAIKNNSGKQRKQFLIYKNGKYTKI